MLKQGSFAISVYFTIVKLGCSQAREKEKYQAGLFVMRQWRTGEGGGGLGERQGMSTRERMETNKNTEIKIKNSREGL